MSETKLDWPKLMEEALTAPGNLGATYSRFHDYSITNEMLFFMQGLHEPVASGSRWQALGRTLIKGAKPKQVIVPVLVNEPEPESDAAPKPDEETREAKRERVARLIGFKLIPGAAQRFLDHSSSTLNRPWREWHAEAAAHGLVACPIHALGRAAAGLRRAPGWRARRYQALDTRAMAHWMARELSRPARAAGGATGSASSRANK